MDRGQWAGDFPRVVGRLVGWFGLVGGLSNFAICGQERGGDLPTPFLTVPRGTVRNGLGTSPNLEPEMGPPGFGSRIGEVPSSFLTVPRGTVRNGVGRSPLRS